MTANSSEFGRPDVDVTGSAFERASTKDLMVRLTWKRFGKNRKVVRVRITCCDDAPAFGLNKNVEDVDFVSFGHGDLQKSWVFGNHLTIWSCCYFRSEER